MFDVYPYLLVLDQDYKHLDTISRKLPTNPCLVRDRTVSVNLGTNIVDAQNRLDAIAYLLPSEVVIRDPQRVVKSVAITGQANESRSEFWLQSESKEVPTTTASVG